MTESASRFDVARSRPEVRKRNATPGCARGALLRYVTYEETWLQMFPGDGQHLSARDLGMTSG
ncbi:hypothetical protein PSP6_320006 [Paraburkholderia tropica]|nr:hypothetical protein PSP6_320006 [Paraburkholderia tropica]